MIYMIYIIYNGSRLVHVCACGTGCAARGHGHSHLFQRATGQHAPAETKACVSALPPGSVCGRGGEGSVRQELRATMATQAMLAGTNEGRVNAREDEMIGSRRKRERAHGGEEITSKCTCFWLFFCLISSSRPRTSTAGECRGSSVGSLLSGISCKVQPKINTCPQHFCATAWRRRHAGGLHLSPRTRLLKPGAIRLDPSAAPPIARRAASPGPPAPHIVSMFQSGFMS